MLATALSLRADVNKANASVDNAHFEVTLIQFETVRLDKNLCTKSVNLGLS